MLDRDQMLELCHEIYYRVSCGDFSYVADQRLLIGYLQTWTLDDFKVHGYLFNTMGVVSYYAGYLQEAFDHFWTASEEFDEGGQIEDALMALSNAVHVASLLGNYGLAARHADHGHQLLATQTPTDSFGGVGAFKIHAALYDALSDQTERAEVLLREVLAAAIDQPRPIQKKARFGAYRGLALLQAKAGNFAAAEAYLQDARAELSASDISILWLNYHLAAILVGAAHHAAEQVVIHQAAVWALIERMRHSQMQVAFLNSAVLALHLGLNQQMTWMLNMGAFHLSVLLTPDLAARYGILRGWGR